MKLSSVFRFIKGERTTLHIWQPSFATEIILLATSCYHNVIWGGYIHSILNGLLEGYGPLKEVYFLKNCQDLKRK